MRLVFLEQDIINVIVSETVVENCARISTWLNSMENQKIQFNGYDLFLKTFKSNKDSFRVEIDCGKESYDVLKEIPNLPEGVYKITITPIIDEN